MPQSLTIDRYLSSPILSYATDFFRKNHGSFLKEMPDSDCLTGPLEGVEAQRDRSLIAVSYYCKDLITQLKKDGKHLADTIRVFDAADLPKLLNLHLPPSKHAKKSLTRAMLAVRPIITAHVQSLEALAGLVGSEGLPNIMSSQILCLSTLLEEFDRPVRELYSKCILGGQRIVRVATDDMYIVMTPEIGCIESREYKGEVLIMSYNQLLMLKDCVLSRRNALLSARIMYPESNSLESLIQRSWEWQEKCLTRYGNKGYQIAKATEALSKTFLSRLSNDPLSCESDSFANMMEKNRVKEQGMPNFDRPLVVNEGYLADIFKQDVLDNIPNIQECVEIFGVQKLIGHPVIDIRAGGRSLQKIGKEVHDIRQSDVEILRNTFRKLFIVEFVHREKRWPRMRFHSHGTSLERAYDLQALNIHSRTFPLYEFSVIQFEKELEFNYYPDYLEVLDDKAVSLRRDEKHLNWDLGTPSTKRRLLLEIMSRPTYSIEEIVDLVEADEVPLWMYAEATVPKELEFKDEGRQFGLSFPDIRQFFVVEEANLAETLLPYFPQITMMEGKLDTHRRMMGLTSPPSDEHGIKLLTELDLSAWNTRWRGLVVEPVGQDINDLFGMRRTFTFVHKYYERCVIYIKTPGSRPHRIDELTPPDSDLCWSGHLGGIEGRAQKLWSICTVCMVHPACDALDIGFTLTDQGDNILAIFNTIRDYSIELFDQLKALGGRVLPSCEDRCKRVGQVLNPDECILSTKVLTYSKVVYVDGVDYPTSIKSLMRTKPASATNFPSFSNEIRSLFAGAYSAAEVSRRPERCYWIALYQSALLLLQEATGSGVFSRIIGITGIAEYPERLRFMLILPPELGGLPIIGPYKFLYRGGGDPTSKAIAGLKMVQKFLPQARQALSLLDMEDTYVSDPKIESLIQDPYGFPIKKPKGAELSVADITLDSLKAYTQNKDFIDLFNFASEEYEAEIVANIKELRPFNPVIARDVYDCSALGTVNAVKKAFLNTGSIQTTMRAKSEESVIDIVISASKDEIYHVSKQFKRSFGKERELLFVYPAVQRARSRWSKAGVSPVGITSYLPIDFNLLVNPPRGSIGIKMELQPFGTDLMFSRGRIEPYYGSRTIQVMSEYGYRLVGHGPAFSALRSLQSIYSWSDKGPEISYLVDYLSHSRAGIRLSQYDGLLAGRLGGDQGHRYDDRTGERGAYLLGYTTFSSHCLLDSNSAGFLSASVDDFKVMVQEFFLYLISIGGFRWDRFREESRFTLMVDIGREAIDLLNMPPLTMEQVVPLVPMPHGLKFVQSDEIYVRKISGFKEGALINPASDNGISVKESAVVEEFYSKIYSRSGIDSMVSHLRGGAVKDIGVQEMAGVGVRRLSELFCVAMFDCLAREIPSARRLITSRTSIAAIIADMSDLLVGTILQYWSHPLVQADEWVQSLLLYDGPSYNPSSSRARILKSSIADILDRMLNDPSSAIFTTPVVVFSSTKAGGTTDAYLRLMRRTLFRRILEGDIDYSDASRALGALIREFRILKQEDEEENPDRLVEAVGSFLAKEKSRGGDLGESSIVLQRIVSGVAGYQVVRCNKSTNAVIREFRYNIPPSTVAPRCVDWSHRLPLAYAVETETSKKDWIHQDSLRSDLSMCMTRISKAHSLGVRAMEVWMPFQRLFNGQNVLVVGSGEGAAAAVALLGGCKIVRGHDLRADYPYGVLHSEYVPPMVKLYCRRRDYQQTEETISTTGDWFEDGISQRLIRTPGGVSCVVLDISTVRGRGPEVLYPLIRSGYQGFSMVRVRGDRYSHEWMVGALEANGVLLGAWVGKEYLGIRDSIFSFLLRGTELNLAYGRRYLVAEVGIPPARVRRTIKRVCQELTAPSSVPVVGLVRRIIENSLESAIEMINSGMNRYEYSDMTDLLITATACEILLSGGPTMYVCEVGEMLLKGRRPLRGWGGRDVLLTNRARQVLTRISPMIMGNMDAIIT